MEPSFKIKSNCYSCKIPFIIEYPFGGEYRSCPICGSDPEYKKPENIYDLYNTLSFGDSKDIEYCFTCNIIYKEGCKHAEHGCTASTYHTKFLIPNNTDISNLEINVFTDYDTCDKFLQMESTKTNYKWMCTCKLHGSKSICKYAFYTKEKYPIHYNNCI